MRRARVFAAPFVVTVALTGCKGSDAPAKETKPPPPVTVDAQLKTNPPTPVADAAPAAPVGATIVREGRGCYVYPYKHEGDLVACPPEGATLVLASAARKHHPHDDISFEQFTMSCTEFVPSKCPPNGTCNPPPPKPVPCPADLLPVLRPDLEPIRKDGHCFWHTDGGDVEVECVGALPAPPAGARVFSRDGICFVLDEGRVQCPEGGPAIRLGPEQLLRDGSATISFSAKVMGCVRSDHTSEEAVQVECPERIMPRLREDLQPERKDGKCTFEGIQVVCP